MHTERIMHSAYGGKNDVAFPYYTTDYIPKMWEGFKKVVWFVIAVLCLFPNSN